MNKNIGFPTALVSRISGATPRQLQKWDESGLLVPSIFEGAKRDIKHKRLYSFADLIAAKVIYQLRQVPINMSQIFQVRETLAACGRSFTDSRLLILGDEIYITGNEQAIAMLHRPGQMVFYSLVVNLDIAAIEQEVIAALKAA
jgi:DNA-binding transcriptional MerR regulator